MLKAMSSQLLFGRDMILNTPFVTYWKSIMRHNQELIYQNNQNKNKNYKPHNYRVREKVLVRDKKANKYK